MAALFFKFSENLLWVPVPASLCTGWQVLFIIDYTGAPKGARFHSIIFYLDINIISSLRYFQLPSTSKRIH